ncbi:MAG TPA: hypothetical protein VLZ83_10740 [Edaphocola sp.]|nr:hypothetical protein [Edaphocola sp.]
MKKLLILPTVLLGLSLLCLNACKKDNKKKETCKIQKFTDNSGGDVTIFSYDDNFKLVKMSGGTRESNFSYGSNQKTILTTDGGVFDNKKIITYDNQSKIINVKAEFNTSGTDWDNISYNYSGNDLIKYTSTSSSSPTPNVTNFVWENGNISKIIPSSGPATILEYYLDKEFQDADYLSLSFLLQYGESPIRYKNLLKSFSSQEVIYGFDAEGKINTLNIGSSSFSIDYLCK